MFGYHQISLLCNPAAGVSVFLNVDCQTYTKQQWKLTGPGVKLNMLHGSLTMILLLGQVGQAEIWRFSENIQSLISGCQVLIIHFCPLPINFQATWNLSFSQKNKCIAAQFLPGCSCSRYYLIDVNTWAHIWKFWLTFLEISD